MKKRSLIAASEAGVCTITLNRPESMNALNQETLDELAAVVKKLQFDRSTRVVIVTGTGRKAFCAGADLKERVNFSPDQVRRFITTISETFTAIEALPQPVIAVINGVALGGGIELALVCDLRIASEQATMGLTEVKRAVIPVAGGTQRLPRLIGKGRATEMILTGRVIGAEEALDIGLVNRVVAASELMESAMELANQMLENGPIALRQAKLAIRQGWEMNLSAGLVLENAAYEATIPTKDRVEGFTAFREKRRPVYVGE